MPPKHSFFQLSILKLTLLGTIPTQGMLELMIFPNSHLVGYVVIVLWRVLKHM